MKDNASYVFSAYSAILSLPEDQILHAGYQSANGNPIPSFDENLLINLCIDAQKLFEKENNIIEIEGDAIVIGDIHGSLHDLLRILKYIESTNANIIFLGDYVDRGSFSLECITLLFTYKVLYPKKFFFIRGNHEFDSMCSTYGFKKEILNYHNPKKQLKLVTSLNTSEKDKNGSTNKESDKNDDNISKEILCDSYYENHINMNCHKYTEKLYLAFMEAFAYLPICAIVNKTSLCIHGGLSPQLNKIDKIKKKIKRPIYNFDENKLLSDVIWGDPSHEEMVQTSSQLFYDNPRGRGNFFTGMALSNFLRSNNLKRIIRAHQCVFNGIEESFKEKCITVFSASSYDHQYGNSSGILKIYQKGERILPVIFDPLDRLEKSDTLYYKVQAFKKEVTRPMFNVYNIKTSSSYSSENSPLPNYLIQKVGGKIHENKSQVFILNSNANSLKRSIIANKKNKTISIFNCKKFCYDCTFTTGAQKKNKSYQSKIAGNSIQFDFNGQPLKEFVQSPNLAKPDHQITLPKLDQTMNI